MKSVRISDVLLFFLIFLSPKPRKEQKLFFNYVIRSIRVSMIQLIKTIGELLNYSPPPTHIHTFLPYIQNLFEHTLYAEPKANNKEIIIPLLALTYARPNIYQIIADQSLLFCSNSRCYNQLHLTPFNHRTLATMCEMSCYFYFFIFLSLNFKKVTEKNLQRVYKLCVYVRVSVRTQFTVPIS